MRTTSHPDTVITPSGRRRLTPPEAAKHIGAAEQTLAVWRSTGRYGIPFVKVGRKVFYFEDDLDQFLAERTVTSTGELAARTAAF